MWSYLIKKGLPFQNLRELSRPQSIMIQKYHLVEEIWWLAMKSEWGSCWLRNVIFTRLCFKIVYTYTFMYVCVCAHVRVRMWVRMYVCFVMCVGGAWMQWCGDRKWGGGAGKKCPRWNESKLTTKESSNVFKSKDELWKKMVSRIPCRRQKKLARTNTTRTSRKHSKRQLSSKFKK